MLRPMFAFALLALPAVASAQQNAPRAAAANAGEQVQDTTDGQTPKRIRNVQLTGNDPCPKAQGDEIVVCSRINPDEQYRIPKALRNSGEVAAKNQSWVNRTAVGEDVSRVAGGLPDTCSPVGTGGQTGCWQQQARAFAAEKKAAEKNDAMVP